MRRAGEFGMIDIYTDGACIDNPSGPGGWAAIVVQDGAKRILSGREARATSNRMEMLAVIEGLAAVPAESNVRVHSDSQYVVNTMTKNWKRNVNVDLWARLDSEAAKRRVSWIWVKGHAGHPLNEKADKVAKAEAGGKPIPSGLTHVDAAGAAQMVDVGSKQETERTATAKAAVLMRPETLSLIEADGIEKGDVLGVARIAGIMAAKNTSSLIPLCHPLPLDQVQIECRADRGRSAVEIVATARTTAKTGVEMEAMTGAAVAALTIYDMCKAVDRGMRIAELRLVRKSGGKSGDFVLD